MSFRYMNPEDLSDSQRLTISTIDYLKSKVIKHDSFGKPVFVFLNFNHPVFKKAKRGECQVKMTENRLLGIPRKFTGQVSLLEEHGMMVIEPNTHCNIGWVFDLKEATTCSSECNNKYVKDGFITRRRFKNKTTLKFPAGKLVMKFKGYKDNSDWFHHWNAEEIVKPVKKKRLAQLFYSSDDSSYPTTT